MIHGEFWSNNKGFLYWNFKYIELFYRSISGFSGSSTFYTALFPLLKLRAWELTLWVLSILEMQGDPKSMCFPRSLETVAEAPSQPKISSNTSHN
jgi:hypothetical protein